MGNFVVVLLSRGLMGIGQYRPYGPFRAICRCISVNSKYKLFISYLDEHVTQHTIQHEITFWKFWYISLVNIYIYMS